MPATPPAAPGSLAPTPPKKLPGLVGIWIGVILMVLGVVVGVTLIVAGARTVLGGVDDLQRVSIREGGAVNLDETGTVSVYAERRVAGSGGGFTTGGYSYVPPVGIMVTGPDRVPVPVVTSSGGSTFTSGGREGVELASFHVDQPGTYRIETVLRGDPAPYTTLSVGNPIDADGFAGIAGGILIGGLLFVVGLIVLIVSIVRRSKARKANRPPIPWTPVGPPAAYGAGAAGAGWAPPPVVAPGAYGPGAYGPPQYGPPQYGPPQYGPPPSGPPNPPSAPGWVPPPAPPAPPGPPADPTGPTGPTGPVS